MSTVSVSVSDQDEADLGPSKGRSAKHRSLMSEWREWKKAQPPPPCPRHHVDDSWDKFPEGWQVELGGYVYNVSRTKKRSHKK